MMSGDSDRESAFGGSLATDTIKNRTGYICFFIFNNDFGVDDFFFFFKMKKEVMEIIDANNIESREERSLFKIFTRKIYFREAGGLSGFEDVDDTTNGTNFSIKGKLSDEETIFDVGG